MKNKGNETTSKAPTITRRFNGRLSHFRPFVNRVVDWYESAYIQDLFKKCDDLPVYMHPCVQSKNRYAMGAELGQIGAEITVSARFWQNVLLPVLHSCRTMRFSNTAKNVLPLDPKDLDCTIGDSFIVPMQQRIPSLQPDVVFKFTIGEKQEVRLVGELKSCATVLLGEMVALARKNEGRRLFGVLGTSRFPFRDLSN